MERKNSEELNFDFLLDGFFFWIFFLLSLCLSNFFIRLFMKSLFVHIFGIWLKAVWLESSNVARHFICTGKTADWEVHAGSCHCPHRGTSPQSPSSEFLLENEGFYFHKSFLYRFDFYTAFNNCFLITFYLYQKCAICLHVCFFFPISPLSDP